MLQNVPSLNFSIGNVAKHLRYKPLRCETKAGQSTYSLNNSDVIGCQYTVLGSIYNPAYSVNTLK